jgi:hypothetical protein
VVDLAAPDAGFHPVAPMSLPRMHSGVVADDEQHAAVDRGQLLASREVG